MSLNAAKNQLKSDIVAILTDLMTRENTSIEEFADRLSMKIYEFVCEAKIVYENGLTAPNGAVAGTFNGHLE